ncbi:MAG: hypothetical protein AAFN92_17105, partial [Bacteroidota bacterium]
MTVAIGRALEPFGVAVNHDNLLALSRWPALHEGHLRRRLREELLADLPVGVEKAARAALAEELKKARPAAVGGNAARELEGVLAVQTFSLDHGDAEAKAAVAELLREGALSADALKDLRREVALESSPELAVNPFAQLSEEGKLAQEQGILRERPVDGPVGYTELHREWEKARASGDFRAMQAVLFGSVGKHFKAFTGRAEELGRQLSAESGVEREKARLLGFTPEESTLEQVDKLLEEIRNSEPNWVSKTDFTGRFTATQTVARMVETGRLPGAVAYLEVLQQQDFPELDKQRETLQQRLTAYLERQSPPATKAQKAPRRKTATPNLAATALRAEIEQLAANMDRIRQERASEQLRANEQAVAAQQRPSSLSAENVSLEEYFLEAEPTEQEQEAPVKVPVPGWWPALATFTALALLLLFILLYPLHHSSRLYQWAGEGNSWFTRAIEPDDRGIIYHKDGLEQLRRFDLQGLAQLTNAIDTRQGDYPAAQRNLATGLYNHYAR